MKPMSQSFILLLLNFTIFTFLNSSQGPSSAARSVSLDLLSDNGMHSFATGSIAGTPPISNPQGFTFPPQYLVLCDDSPEIDKGKNGRKLSVQIVEGELSPKDMEEMPTLPEEEAMALEASPTNSTMRSAVINFVSATTLSASTIAAGWLLYAKRQKGQTTNKLDLVPALASATASATLVGYKLFKAQQKIRSRSDAQDRQPFRETAPARTLTPEGCVSLATSNKLETTKLNFEKVTTGQDFEAALSNFIPLPAMSSEHNEPVRTATPVIETPVAIVPVVAVQALELAITVDPNATNLRPSSISLKVPTSGCCCK